MDRRALLASMLAIRAFEDVLARYPDAGFQLYSSGEEAVAVGVCAALRKHDQLLSSGRSIGPALARGLDPGAVMAELLGRATGPCKGKAGRGHLAQPAAGFFGAHAVVGGNLTIAAGVALAMQSQRTGGIVACIFGDGACGSGALHETLNIAALWKLPLLLVCDDNGWSISTPREVALAPRWPADLAAPFGIRAASVDGMDVLAVRDAATELASHVRSGAGPAFLACDAERFSSHSTATRETRTHETMEVARARCPIRRLAKTLRDEGALDESALAALERAAADAAASALRYAEASPPTGVDEIRCDVD
ncbi:MAG TPA: thiamine pyrophosphate-dependent dehydrogenase E1 component subunit alpha [Casimicrobiaceae bacterium]|jgi:TPP-dependent pyruvate/acetoin dehydrogenase alpha subunit